MLSNLYKYIAKFISNRKLLARYFDDCLTHNRVGSRLVRQMHDRFIIPVNPDSSATLDDRIEDLIAYGKKLNSQGIELIADLLGEDVTSVPGVKKFVFAYKQIAIKMNKAGINGYISLKGSMLGQALNLKNGRYNVNNAAEELFYNNMVEILNAAKGRFIRMDAEYI